MESGELIESQGPGVWRMENAGDALHPAGPLGTSLLPCPTRLHVEKMPTWGITMIGCGSSTPYARSSGVVWSTE